MVHTETVPFIIDSKFLHILIDPLNICKLSFVAAEFQKFIFIEI